MPVRVPIGVTQLEFRPDLWHQKTRVPDLSYGVACVILGLSFLVQHLRVTDTDGKTDGRTHDDSMYRASIASRGKNRKDSHTYAIV